MRKINVVIVTVLLSLGLTSCSSEESITPEEISQKEFNSYELKRDASGAYSFDINVESDVSVGKVKNTNNNTNELYLSHVDNLESKNDYGTDLWFNNENFKIEIISKSYNKLASISIVDDNIKYDQKSVNDFLKEYSIIKNDEGTYDLDFSVANKINVDFVYDSVNSIYEIHLNESEKSQESNYYSRTLEKEEGESLQIHFVNHSSALAKGLDGGEMMTRKPVIIIDEGEDL